MSHDRRQNSFENETKRFEFGEKFKYFSIVVRVGRNFPGKFEFVPNGMEFHEILGPLETSRVRLGIRGRRNLRGDTGTIP